ncbi:MAG TPA: DoxX family protein [Candidatus Paceibacterota bacterium]|nr:DoxX family protein [Candidatus Paceibacterota bacterium]
MKNITAKWVSWGPYFQAILRIVTAFLFLLTGTSLLFAFPVASPHGGAALMSQIGIGAVLEIVGGFLVLIGLFTRPAAFIISGEMAVAYFQFHFPQGFWPIVNGGTESILYCFIFLFLSAAGAGAWSFDAKRKS